MQLCSVECCSHTLPRQHLESNWRCNTFNTLKERGAFLPHPPSTAFGEQLAVRSQLSQFELSDIVGNTCNTLQHLATPCNTLATPSNTLQHPATPCNTLQHPATPLQHPERAWSSSPWGHCPLFHGAKLHRLNGP